MGEIQFPDKSTYWVANSIDSKVIHWGITDPNQVTTTGQPVFNTFDTKTKCEDKLIKDLKVTVEKLAENPLSDKIIVKWSDKMTYKKGDKVIYKDVTYIVLSDHTSDKSKTPDITKEWYRLSTILDDVSAKEVLFP